MAPLIVVALLGACGGGDRGERPAAEGGSAHTYEVDGVVRALPHTAADGRRRLIIAHDEIPDFVSSTGETVGMSAMTMPFPLAEDVEVSDLTVGDSIHFRFEVDWDASPRYQIVAIERTSGGDS